MNFNESLKRLLLVEGKTYSNRAADRGGPTKYGVTQKTLNYYIKVVLKDSFMMDVRDLTEETARDIYLKLYWTPLKGIPEGLLKYTVFDQGVNSGVKSAVKRLQKAINMFRQRKLSVDGILGPKTLKGLESQDEINVLYELLKLSQRRYVKICQLDSTQLDNLGGWTNRIFHILDDVLTELNNVSE